MTICRVWDVPGGFGKGGALCVLGDNRGGAAPWDRGLEREPSEKACKVFGSGLRAPRPVGGVARYLVSTVTVGLRSALSGHQ